jgi:hypothetical protein
VCNARGAPIAKSLVHSGAEVSSEAGPGVQVERIMVHLFPRHCVNHPRDNVPQARPIESRYAAIVAGSLPNAGVWALTSEALECDMVGD